MVVASPLPALTSFNGIAVGPGTPYDLVIQRGTALAATADLSLRPRPNQYPVAEGVSYGGGQYTFLVRRGTTAPAQATWQLAVRALFQPARSTPRLLAGTFNSVAVTLAVYITSLDILAGTSGEVFLGTFVAPDPLWQATTPTTGTGLTYTPAGNAAAQPVYTLTPTGSTAARFPLTVTDQTGRGLSNHIIAWGPFGTTGMGATDPTNYDLLFNRRRLPFTLWAPNTSATYVFAQVTVERYGTLTGDLYIGSSVNNLVTANQLPLAGRALNPGWTNTHWQWDTLDVGTNPDVDGAWQFARVTTAGASITTTGSTTFSIIPASFLGITERSDDAILLMTGVETASGAPLAGWLLGPGTTVQYRLPGDVSWRSFVTSGAANLPVPGAVAIAITTTPDVVVIAGIDPLSGVLGLDLDPAKAPVATVGAPVAAQVGPYTLTNTTTEGVMVIGADYAYIDDGEGFVIDTSTGGMLPSGGVAFWDSHRFSDPDRLLALEPGVANVFTVTAGCTLSATYAARYAL